MNNYLLDNYFVGLFDTYELNLRKNIDCCKKMKTI